MRCSIGKLGWSLSVCMATIVIGMMNSNAVRADIVLNGDVAPAASALWDSSTDGYVGQNDGYSGTVTITSGGDCYLPANNSYIGYGIDSYGLVTVSGSGAIWNNESNLNVGYYGYGELHILGGGSVTNTNALLGFDGNYSDDPAGIVEVDGPGSTWTNRGDLSIGYGPLNNGTVQITNGAEVHVDGITQVAVDTSSTGTIAFGSAGGTLTTKTLRASASQMTGVGTIQAKGLVSDQSLTFDGLNATQGWTQTVPLNSGNINVHLDMSDSGNVGDLGVGYKSSGSLVIQNGITVTSTGGYLGYHSSASGTALVTGSDSKWIVDGATHVGYSGSGTLTVSNGGTVETVRFGEGSGGTGEIHVDGGTLQALRQCSPISFTTGLDVYIGNDGMTVDTNGQEVTISEVLQPDTGSSGGLTKTGSGTLILKGANTYAGTTTAVGGILLALKPNTLPGYTTPGRVDVQSGGVLGVSIASAMTPDWAESEILTLVDNATWAADGTSSLAIDCSKLNRTFASVLSNPSSGASISLVKLGSGAITLTAPSTYGGETRIDVGSLVVGVNDALPVTTDVTVAGSFGVSLNLNNYSQTIASLSGGGSWGGTVILGSGTLTVSGTASTTFVGGISGAGGCLVKQGDGTLKLTGSNSYTGQTIVNGGILELGGSAQNAVLTVGGADLQSGMMIFDYVPGSGFPPPPPSAPDVLTPLRASYTGGTAAWTTGQFQSSTADPEHGLGWIDNGSDQVTVMYTLYGDSNLDGSVNGTDLNAVLSYYNQSSQVWACGDFNYDGSVNGTDLNTVLSNYNQSLSSSTAAVPEPSTLLLMVLGLVGWLAWRRK